MKHIRWETYFFIKQWRFQDLTLRGLPLSTGMGGGRKSLKVLTLKVLVKCLYVLSLFLLNCCFRMKRERCERKLMKTLSVLGIQYIRPRPLGDGGAGRVRPPPLDPQVWSILLIGRNKNSYAIGGSTFWLPLTKLFT